MQYREYVPTCVETLFGKPPTKFKARAIIPGSKTFNMDGGRCACCTCEQHNSPKKTFRELEDFPGNDNQYRCIMECPDCRKNIVPNNERAIEKRGIKTRSRKKRVDHSYYECYCAPTGDYTEEEYYPEERSLMKQKAIKNKNYSSEPSRSTNSTDHSDTDRFCSVCKLWVKSDSKEKRNEYSSKRYEYRDRVEDSKTPKEAPSSKRYHFVVECCKFCGNRRNGPSESDRKREDNCQALKNMVQNKGLRNKAEQCSVSEGFLTIEQIEDPQMKSKDEEERDPCDELYERFVAEMAAMEECPQTPIDGDLIEHNSQEEELNSNKEISSNRGFRKAHSTSEINNIEKQNNNNSESLEEYKEQLITELKEKSREKSPQKNEFRSCNCEYAHKDWKSESQSKQEPDKSEIRLLRKKCDEALVQLELFKREIAISKQEKCHCDLESTMCIVEDCKQRCAQLEKQVVCLKQCIDYYTRPKPERKETNWEFRKPQKAIEKQSKKPERPIRSASRKRDTDREVITANVKVSKKPKSTCPPVVVRKMGCQHIRCFPQDQIPDISSFQMCSGYQEIQRRINKR